MRQDNRRSEPAAVVLALLLAAAGAGAADTDVRLVDAVLGEAVMRRASDVHVEAFEE